MINTLENRASDLNLENNKIDSDSSSEYNNFKKLKKIIFIAITLSR